MMGFKQKTFLFVFGWILGAVLTSLFSYQSIIQDHYLPNILQHVGIQHILKIIKGPTLKLAEPIPFKNRSGPFVINDLNRVYDRSKDHVAIDLAKRIRVLCWVMTSPKSYKIKAQAVKDTWGKRCNIILYMSSKEDPDFPLVGLNVPEGRENLWLKTRAAWKYVYENHYNDAEWFIKADDDTFVVVENLRLYLDKYNTTDNHYFGMYVYHFRFHSGGAGYVFSKKTLVEFHKLLLDPKKCALKAPAEDVQVANCLRSVGINPEMAYDSEKNSLFHSTQFWRHWLGLVQGHKCCTKNIITLHHLQTYEIRMLFNFFYKIRTHGVWQDDE